MISLDLIVEQLANPADSVSEFDGQAWSQEHPVEEPEEILAIREAQVGLFLNAATARNIGYMLLAKVDEIDPPRNEPTSVRTRDD